MTWWMWAAFGVWLGLGLFFWAVFAGSEKIKRRGLVELLERDIARSDNIGPDWPTVVEDAVLRQDMQWVEDVHTDV